MQDDVVFDDEVRYLPSGDRDPHIVQQLRHLWLAHLRPAIQGQHQALDPGAALPVGAWGQRRQEGLMLGRGVKLLLMDNTFAKTEMRQGG